MDDKVFIAIISVSGALLGTVIGALSTYWSTRSAARFEWRQRSIQDKIARREELYAQFMAEAGNLVLQAMDKKANSVATFSKLTELAARIELFSEPVGKVALQVTSHVIGCHVEKKKEEDPMSYHEHRKNFISACKEDFESIMKNA